MTSDSGNVFAKMGNFASAFELYFVEVILSVGVVITGLISEKWEK